MKERLGLSLRRLNNSLLSTLGLTLIKDPKCFLSSLDTTENHGTESRAHAVEAVNFRQLHSANDETLGHLTGVLDDRVLGGVHVQTTHTTELVDGRHGDESLGREGTEGTVVASGTDDNRGVDGVGVHARVVVVVEGDEGPVGNHTSDLDFLCTSAGGGAGHQVLNTGGVEELDVGELKDLREQCRREERCVLDDDIVGHLGVLFIGHTQFVQEELCRTTHDHRGEELATQPSATT